MAIFTQRFMEDGSANERRVEIYRVVILAGYGHDLDFRDLALEDLAEFLEIELLRHFLAAAHRLVHVEELFHDWSPLAVWIAVVCR